MQRFDPDFLKRTAESPAVRAIKDRGYQLLELAPGNRVLDVGCGPAIDTVPLARLVGPTGLVLGIDADPLMVQEANQVAAREGVGTYTRHLAGDATALMLASGAVDACFCERVFQHIPWINVPKVATEILRVVRPGGKVVVIDTDWATLSIGAEDPWLERRIVAEHAMSFANPFSGRYLLSLFRGIGLVDMSVETFTLELRLESLEFLLAPTLQRGVATGRIAMRDAQRWSYGLRALAEYGRFFAHISMVLMAGRKQPR
jgi:ubiquinone/menaquinone biosynthesis C-methylase UbiE